MWHLTINEDAFNAADAASKRPLPTNYILGIHTKTDHAHTKPSGRYGLTVTEVREDLGKKMK